MRGRQGLESLSGAGLEQSLDYFTQALTLEPTYAQAHAGVAFVHSLRAGLSFVPPKQVMPAAKQAAEKALDLSDTVADAHRALAMALDWYEWNRPAADREHRLASKLNPADAHGLSWYADLLYREGRAQDAVATARDAVAQDPLPGWSRFILALSLHTSRRFDEAIAEANAGIDLAPIYPPLHWARGWALGAMGRYDEAVEAARTALAATPGDPHPMAQLGWALGLAGQQREAQSSLKELQRRRENGYVSGYLMAHACLGAGEPERALRWLEQGAEDRDCLLSHIPDPRRSGPPRGGRSSVRIGVRWRGWTSSRQRFGRPAGS